MTSFGVLGSPSGAGGTSIQAYLGLMAWTAYLGLLPRRWIGPIIYLHIYLALGLRHENSNLRPSVHTARENEKSGYRKSFGIYLSRKRSSLIFS